MAMWKALAQFALAVAVTVALGAAPAAAQLEGSYKAIGDVPAANSTDTVLFEEYINFTCPHCNNFRKAAQPLKEKYGDRLKLVDVPILFRGQADHPIRLYYVAAEQGRAEEVKNLIFDAAFKYGADIYDPTVVSYLARSADLGQAYEQNANSERITQKVRRAQQKATQAGVQVTPTVVLEGSLLVVPEQGMQAFVNNLDRLIGQMLR